MRRGAIGLTMITALVIGALAGVVLFTQVGPVPLPATAGPADPTSSGSVGESASPSTSRSTAPSASPTSSATPSAKPSSASPAPPFTIRALLEASEFKDVGGWGTTTLIDIWDDVPPKQISSCTEPQNSDGKRVAAHSALYRGQSTSAVEVVTRYGSDQAARTAVARLTTRIRACATEPAGDPDLTAAEIQVPDPAELSEVHLWDTTGTNGSKAQGAVGIVRTGDRVAFLTMISLTTDPIGTADQPGTTKIGPLLIQAGRRLV